MTGLALTMYPGSDGDALALRWGPTDAPRHAVIDLGRTKDYRRLRSWLTETGRIDLLVFTHIDADHIEGAMPMVAEPTAPFDPSEVWFNAHHHLRQARNRRDEHEVLSVLQGEKLSDGLARFGWAWNMRFGGGPVSTDSAEGAAPIDMHGLRITLLSPDDASLSALERDWDKALRANALRRGDPDEAPSTPEGLERLSTIDVEALARRPYRPDRKTPNGSSIAFLAEYEGRSVMLAGDAHSDVLTTRIRALGYSTDNRLKVDLFKLSHHGSSANLSTDLLTLIDCTRFAISTDASRHGFPDPETIARILKADPDREKTFYFNFRQRNATLWNDATLQGRWNYQLVVPPEGQEGIRIHV